jgi:predicted nucleic acid-binding protein
MRVVLDTEILVSALLVQLGHPRTERPSRRGETSDSLFGAHRAASEML